MAGDEWERGSVGCSCRFASHLRLFAVRELAIGAYGRCPVVVITFVRLVSMVEVENQ